MPANKPLVLAITTCPDVETARRLATQLVERRLAACVNLIPGVQSIYRWQEAVETDDEVVMLIKTRTSAIDTLNEVLRQQHPYDVPELITCAIDNGFPEYLDWVVDSTDA